MLFLYGFIKKASLVFLIQVFAINFVEAAANSIDYCWKTSYGRQAGNVGLECPAGQHLGGLLCYDNCPTGFTSNKAGLCVQNCSRGYRDDGLFCRKAEYHVKEYPWQFSDPLNDTGMYSRCEAVHGTGNCWKPLLVVVEKCKPGFDHILGFCRPSGSEYPDCVGEDYAGQFDLSCSKKIETTPSHSTNCESGMEKDGALCYKPCGDNSDGVGPVCWVNCPKDWVACGAGCAKDSGACAAATADQVLSVFDAVVSTALTVASVGGSSASGSVFSKVKKEITSGFAEQFTELAADTGMTVGQGGVSVANTVIDIVGFVEKGNMDPVERDWYIAQKSLELASLIDPTGFVGVAAAFAKPVCNVLPDSYNGEVTTGGIDDLASRPPEAFKQVFVSALQEAEYRVREQEKSIAEVTSELDYFRNDLTMVNSSKKRVAVLVNDIACIRGCAPVKCRVINTRDGVLYKPEGCVKPERFDQDNAAWQAGTYWQTLRWSPEFVAERERERSGMERERDNLNSWIERWDNDFWKATENYFGSTTTLANRLGLGYANIDLENISKNVSLLGFKLYAEKEKLQSLNGTVERLRSQTANASTLQAQLQSKVEQGNAAGQITSVTAALTRANGNATYLFYSDGTYAKTSASKSVGFDGGYPTGLPGGWRGIRSDWFAGIDAALPYQATSRTYMWHEHDYLKLSDVTVSSGYPKPMPGGWQNMPAGWAGNVGAAIHYQPNGKHYFFKGNEYVRLTGVTVDAGYPAKLPGGWRGMPSHFAQGIDAATYRNGHVYMIKGNEYIRFSGTQVEAGYPKSMSRWPE
mgnify:FL=1